MLLKTFPDRFKPHPPAWKAGGLGIFSLRQLELLWEMVQLEGGGGIQGAAACVQGTVGGSWVAEDCEYRTYLAADDLVNIIPVGFP